MREVFFQEVCCWGECTLMYACYLEYDLHLPWIHAMAGFSGSIHGSFAGFGGLSWCSAQVVHVPTRCSMPISNWGQYITEWANFFLCWIPKWPKRTSSRTICQGWQSWFRRVGIHFLLREDPLQIILGLTVNWFSKSKSLSRAVIPVNMMRGMGKGISSLEGTKTGKGFPVAETQHSLGGWRLLGCPKLFHTFSEQKLSCAPLSTSIFLFTCSYTTWQGTTPDGLWSDKF